MIGVSVVVPTCKRPQMLQRCLKAILAQDFDPSNFEVIVVDDAADEQTRRIVEEMAARTTAYRFIPARVLSFHEPSGVIQKPSAMDSLVEDPGFMPVSGLPLLRYIPVLGASHGPAAARNIGWRAAQGEIIAFTDDDCIPAIDWLKNGVSPFEEGISGVNGRVVVPISPHPSDYELDVAGLEKSTFVTANCFYSREILEATGGFDERFKIAWREDSDFFFRVLDQKYHLAYASEAVVIHPVRTVPWGVSIGLQRKNLYNALLYKKHAVMYRRFIQPGPPWGYYAIVVSLLVAGAAFSLGLVWLGVGALGLWGLLTTRFFLSRVRHTSQKWPHLVEMFVTSVLIPPAAVYWRIRGAIKFRVFFL